MKFEILRNLGSKDFPGTAFTEGQVVEVTDVPLVARLTAEPWLARCLDEPKPPKTNEATRTVEDKKR